MNKLPRFTAADFVKACDKKPTTADEQVERMRLLHDPYQFAAAVVNERLDEFEKSCKKVYGESWDGNWSHNSGNLGCETKYTALLFNIEPISQKVKVSEIITALHGAERGWHTLAKDVAERIEKFGIET